MYRAYGLLTPASSFTVDEARTRLAARFPDAAVTLAGGQVTVARGDWEMELLVNDAPAVLDESVGMAEKIAGLGDGRDIESCARRVEVWSETPDPMLEHFADYQAVVEVLQTFPGLIAVDPKEPALL